MFGVEDPARGGGVGSVLGWKAAVSCLVLPQPGLCGPRRAAWNQDCLSLIYRRGASRCVWEWGRTPSQHKHLLTLPSLASVFPISKVGLG